MLAHFGRLFPGASKQAVSPAFGRYCAEVVAVVVAVSGGVLSLAGWMMTVRVVVEVRPDWSVAT
jgi:hypothetical protein